MYTMIANVAAAATPEISNSPYAIFAALVGLAVLLAKVLEKAYEHLIKKSDDHSNGTVAMVQLDPETLKLFHGMQNDIERNQEIIEEHLEEEKVVIDNVREIALCLKDVSRTNERLVKHFDDWTDHVDSSLRSIHEDVRQLKRIG